MNQAIPAGFLVRLHRGVSVGLAHWRGRLWRAIAPLLCCGSACAGVVTVNVTDDAGKPLAQAVVSIEPISGKLAVQPSPVVQVAQVKRQFVPRVSVVTVGTPVAFPNQDTVRHHVYSFSPTKNFELKLYAGIPADPVVFDKPGIAVIGCNIHDQMAAWIAVVDTPFHAITGADGSAKINVSTAGSYRLKVWHPGLPGTADGISQPLTVGAANAEKAVRLEIIANPLVPQP